MPHDGVGRGPQAMYYLKLVRVISGIFPVNAYEFNLNFNSIYINSRGREDAEILHKSLLDCVEISHKSSKLIYII